MPRTIRNLKANQPITVEASTYEVRVLGGGPVVAYVTGGLPEEVGEDGASYEHVSAIHVLATANAQVSIEHE